MRIGVVGARGRLGRWLVSQYDCVPIEIKDISEADEVRDALGYANVQVLINCAAYTDVNGAEDKENADKLYRANHYGVGVLRQEHQGHFIHISTGFVFGGGEKRNGPFIEDDSPAPVNEYGWSKLGGEHAAKMRGPSTVVRVLGLFGPGAHDRADAILENLEAGNEIELSDNQKANFTYRPNMAENLMNFVASGMDSEMLHLVSMDGMTPWKFGQMLADVYGYDHNLIHPKVVEKGAPRPQDCRLQPSSPVGTWKPAYITTHEGIELLKESKEPLIDPDSIFLPRD